MSGLKSKTVEIIIPNKRGGDGRVVMAADCKSVEFYFIVGSIPTLPIFNISNIRQQKNI